MLSDDERVFFEVDDRQDNRRRRNGLELFRAVDQETFRFTEIDFGEVKFYFGAVVGTLRQMRREKAVTSSEAATGGVPTTSGSFESSHATRFPPSRSRTAFRIRTLDFMS